MRAWKALGLGSLFLALTACASSSPEALSANDPYEATNRQTLVLNGKIDRYIVVPTVAVYFVLVPDGGRRAVHNLLGNLSLPTIFLNDALQGEAARGAQTLERLVINTTLGLGGLFDVATSRFHIPGHGEDFGQTLAVWGAGEGPYLMLPFLGPSNPRDATGLLVDTVIDPTNYIAFKQHIWWSGAREYFTVLDLKGQSYQTIQGIQRSSVDYYASLRSLYRQLRDNEIRNGRPKPAADLPDF
jgi:phospholipid-binding lipoprotein MlaA